ncbi:hypothetical protein SmJEL517_g00477 [Synchytrium microbalum]|uniref:SHSP domain-containing protein n=1 Tax=Synchytrium microbalum TaxID=1806994 RepID=A0A507CD88_9FUNG|nr:uncharacterized protein SmJEL517_g00477 [Synchytrium microbalum]TPX37582.1 hypothetical protein SmJEL517_g00477 [Synchytrium microbalum]
MFEDPFFSRTPIDYWFGYPADVQTRPRIEGAREGEGATGEGALTQQQSGWMTPMRGFRAPRIDVEETDKNWILRADVPGIKKEEIKVSMKGDVLTIEGERHDDREEKSSTRHVVERSFGKFRRCISLPSDVNTDSVKADVQNGKLQ